MEHLHVRKYGGDAVLKLARQGDFRDQEQDVPAVFQGFLRQFQIDFRLAGAGDSVQEDGLFAGKGFAGRFGGGFLGGGQGDGCRNGRGFLAPQQRFDRFDFGLVPLPRIFPAGFVGLVLQAFQTRFQPFLDPGFHLLLVYFQGGVGGLVHFADGAEVIGADGAPELDFVREDLGQAFFRGGWAGSGSRPSGAGRRRR